MRLSASIMGKDDLIEAARLGNYPTCEKILSSKPKKPGPFARYSEFLINSIPANNLTEISRLNYETFKFYG